MSKKLTTEEFIKLCRSVHGDEYDYSKTIYQKNTTKVTITCPTHGDFEQTPKEHKKGSGCKQCAWEATGFKRRNTLDSFVEKARSIHGDKYSYHLVVSYLGNKSKVDIVCPIHGVFSQRPNDHTSGYGCPRCGMTKASDKNSLSFEEFVSRSAAVHHGKYTYCGDAYTRVSKKTIITCPEHGDFEQLPSKHMIGSGCPACSADARAGQNRFTTTEFIGRAKSVHGDRYDYSKTVYTGSYSDVVVTCPEHGDFSLKAVYHTQGQGCRHCAVHGFNVDEPGTVYVLKATKFSKMKIGISNHLERRLSELNRRTPFGFTVMATRDFVEGSDASECEKHLHSLYTKCDESGFDGATEWFNLDFNIVEELDNYE